MLPACDGSTVPLFGQRRPCDTLEGMPFSLLHDLAGRDPYVTNELGQVHRIACRVDLFASRDLSPPRVHARRSAGARLPTTDPL